MTEKSLRFKPDSVVTAVCDSTNLDELLSITTRDALEISREHNTEPITIQAIEME